MKKLAIIASGTLLALLSLPTIGLAAPTVSLTNISVCTTDDECHEVAVTPAGYADGEPVFCADVNCGIGDGAVPIDGDNVIRAGDQTGKMIAIQGGEAGKAILQHTFTMMASDDPLTALRGKLAQQLLLIRWFQYSQRN